VENHSISDDFQGDLDRENRRKKVIKMIQNLSKKPVKNKLIKMGFQEKKIGNIQF